MERELWPGLVRWVGTSETTNRGVSSDHRSPTLLPYCSTTADSPRLERRPGDACGDAAARAGAAAMWWVTTIAPCDHGLGKGQPKLSPLGRTSDDGAAALLLGDSWTLTMI